MSNDEMQAEDGSVGIASDIWECLVICVNQMIYLWMLYVRNSASLKFRIVQVPLSKLCLRNTQKHYLHFLAFVGGGINNGV